MKKSNLVLFTGVGIGILCWVISYLMFKGILMGSFIICGSGCEMWPGIRRPFGGCLAMCVDRNGYYPLFFLIGLGCILLSGGILAIRILLVNEKQKIEKKKVVPPAGVEPATSR